MVNKFNGIWTGQREFVDWGTLMKISQSEDLVQKEILKGMMKNKHLAKAIQEQSFYEFKRVITYKALWNNIEIVDVPRFYPSSKTCSECGSYKKDLKLSDREYICEECGCVINLAKYKQLVA